MKVWKIVDEYLMRPPPLKTSRLPTFYPSAAACISDEDGVTPIGACLRANYYRCAGYEKSDQDSVWSQYVFGGGNIWESWFQDKLKGAGVLLASNMKFVDVERYISGEIDALIWDEETGRKIIIEMKTFFGYEAKKNLVGNRNVKPKPKDPHLLQACIYLNHFKDEVDEAVLMYFARDDHTRAEFSISRHHENGKTYPKITTVHLGSEYVYVDKRITLEGIYSRYEDLMKASRDAKLPKPDYMHIYPEEKVIAMHGRGEIAKTRFENWSRNKDKYPIGHFMCGTGDGSGYCSYRTMCHAQKKEDGDV